jgi:hypothetical protein
MAFNPIQTQPFTLAGSGTAIGDSTLVLSSFKQIDGTTTITMTDLGEIGFGTIEPGNGTQEEQICFTGVTQNANGTATLTGVSTVAFSSPYTRTANIAKTHTGGSQFVMSNTSAFYDEYPALPDNATISGQWTFASANSPRMATAVLATQSAQLITKAYADALAIAGAPDATTLVKGIIQLAVATQVQAGTGTGSTGASLVPPNTLFSNTSSATVLIPVTDGTGKIQAGFGGTALGLATLNGSTLVVQNPASASAVAAVSTIPISGTSTTVLADGFQTIHATTAAVLAGGTTSNADATHTHSFEKLAAATTVAVAISNSAAEATLVGYLVPANSLGTLNVLRGKANLSSYSSITGANGVLTLKLKLGSAVAPTTLATLAITNSTGGTVSTNNGWVDFVIYETGVTNAQTAAIQFYTIGNGVYNGTAGTNQDAMAFGNVVGTGTIDSTNAVTLYLTAIFATNNASNLLTVDSSTVEILK